MDSHAHSEGFQVRRLGDHADLKRLEQRCRTLGAGIQPLKPVGDDPPPLVLIVGAGEHERLEPLLAGLQGDIALLIALEPRALDCPDLLARCHQVLLPPFDEPLLLDHLQAMWGAGASDPLLEEMLRQNIIGRSEAISRLRREIPLAADSQASVAVLGETGTGKELVARALHYCSPRQDRAFVTVNCAALNDELLLAELFGHERGAFTDARQSRRGLVTQADGGTLFLDEVNSLSPRAQGALLRFIQDREYRPLGSERLMHADVRVVCATNRDLRECVDEQSFREDLYYRLSVVDLRVPPLRERHGDVDVLSEHFLGQLGERYDTLGKRLHPLTLDWMQQYRWPGNVRELENHLHRAHVMSPGPNILMPWIDATPINVAGGAVTEAGLGAFSEEKTRAVNRFERDYLERALNKTNGNLSQAARLAGKERRAFARLLDKHGIDRRDFEERPAMTGSD